MMTHPKKETEEAKDDAEDNPRLTSTFMDSDLINN